MMSTERSLEDIARLHAEIMRERAEGLHEAAQTAKTRLAAREKALADLRGKVATLKASLNPAAAPPVPRAAPVILPAKTARRTPAGGWTRYAPYLAIAACAVLLEFGGARNPRPLESNLNAMARPAPSVVLRTRPAATGAPVVIDDDRSKEALLLVHEWKLPGDEKSLGERLGREVDLPGGRPAWRVERTGEHGYRVTFQPDTKDLPYAFEADIESRVVWPTAETQELLAPRFTAAFR